MTRGVVAQCSANEALDIGGRSPGYRPLDQLDLLLVKLKGDFVARLGGHYCVCTCSIPRTPA
jgi:hypothetical protein